MITVRRAVVDDLDAFFASMSLQFAFNYQEGEERDRIRERVLAYGDFERSVIAEDEGVVVGTLGAFAFDMTVPGGSVACAGTTAVTVTPTHRRRGVLRQMITAHFEEAAEHGDPIAALFASDSAIYGRFGYGLAAEELTLTVDRQHADFGRHAPPANPVRMLEATEAATVLPPLHDTMRRDTPGMFSRSEAWWKYRTFRDEESARDGMTALRFAVTSDSEGNDDGYVIFRIKDGWQDDHGAHTVQVAEIMASSPEAWVGLWTFLLGHDLATKIVAPHRPIDDPILTLLAGRRRATQKIDDNLWVRILDIEAALTSRTYATRGSITFGVADPMGISNGTWRLETDGIEATCTPTGDRPELELDIEDLSGALLGRARFAELRRSGRVFGSQQSAVLADQLFTNHRAPVCLEVF